MMHGSLLGLGLGGALVLFGACGGGEDDNNFSISGFNPTQPSPTGVSVSSTGAPTTGEPGTTETTDPPPSTTGEDASTTNPATSVTTTGVDPSTTNVDPSTTNVDPSTTTGVDDTTGMMTSMTTMTTMDQTTGDPPPPPPPPPPGNDKQPLTGVYEHCVKPASCDAPSNICLTLGADPANATDGYCTKACNAAADCGVKPMGPSVQECLLITDTDKVCALKCANGVGDCPIGMVCVNLGLPNNQSGFYCF